MLNDIDCLLIVHANFPFSCVFNESISVCVCVCVCVCTHASGMYLCILAQLIHIQENDRLLFKTSCVTFSSTILFT